MIVLGEQQRFITILWAKGSHLFFASANFYHTFSF